MEPSAGKLCLPSRGPEPAEEWSCEHMTLSAHTGGRAGFRNKAWQPSLGAWPGGRDMRGPPSVLQALSQTAHTGQSLPDTSRH